MNLKQLRSFRKVVELGNMTRAAEALHIAQPALGQQIRQLEDTLGVALLVRHSRGVSPTEAGRLLYERAEHILQLVAETARDVAQCGGRARETLSLGLPPSIALILGPELLLRAAERLPALFLSLHEGASHEVIDAVRENRLDLALAYETGPLPGLDLQPLLEEELLLIGAPGQLQGGEPVPFAEAMAHELALTSTRDIVRRLVDQAAQQQGVPVQLRYEVQSIPALRELALQGAACVVMPYGTAIRELREGRLVGRPITAPAIRRTLRLVRPAGSAGQRALLQDAGLLALLQEMVTLLQQAIAPHAWLPADSGPVR